METRPNRGGLNMPHQDYFNSKGEKVDGVTTIIGSSLGWNKNALKIWGYKCGCNGINIFAKLKEAAELGSLCHKYVECYIYGASVPHEDTKDHPFENILLAEKSVEQFQVLENLLGLRWLETELPLVSDEFNYGGCLDGLCTLDVDKIHPEADPFLIDYFRSLGTNNPVILLDTKTSKGLYPDHTIQMAAYDNLLKEKTDYIRIDGYLFNKIIKESEELELDRQLVKLIPVSKTIIVDGWEIFKSCLEIHRYKRNYEKAVVSLTAEKKTKKSKSKELIAA